MDIQGDPMERTYLSDSNSDYKCLEDYLSLGEFGDLPDQDAHELQADSANNAFILEIVKQYNADFVKNDPNNEILNSIVGMLDAQILPTRYDASTSFHLINSLVTELKNTVERLGIDTKNFPLHATVPTGLINAMAVNLPCSSASFLLFDPQLLTFCSLISKTYARCLCPLENSNSISKDSIAQTIKDNPEIAERLTGVLDALIRNGKPGTSKPFPIHPRSVRLAHDFCKGMELFIVAHEFGHVYSGHLDSTLSKFHMIKTKPGLSTSHKKEYEADYAALIFSIHSLSNEKFEFWQIVASIKLFFSTLDLINRYADHITNGPNIKFTSTESETHPSNEDRKKSIDIAIGHLNIPDEQLTSAVHFGTLIEDTTQLLWNAIADNNS
jgi:hypothetical protein